MTRTDYQIAIWAGIILMNCGHSDFAQWFGIVVTVYNSVALLIKRR